MIALKPVFRKMAEKIYYTYTIPVDEQGQPLIIHRSERFVICHAFDKDVRNVVLKIATDDYFKEKDEIEKAYRRACLARDFSRRTECADCCKIYDAELNNEDFYIAMQYIKGIPLDSILHDIDIVENSGDLDALARLLRAACDRLTGNGLKPAALSARNIFLRQDTDGIVLLNYAALPEDDMPESDRPAEDFVDRIRAEKVEERNTLLAAQQEGQRRQRRMQRRLWIGGVAAFVVCVLLYVWTETSIPKRIEANWKYDAVEAVGDLFRVRLGSHYGVLSAAYREVVPVEYDTVRIDPRHVHSFVVYRDGQCGVFHTGQHAETIAVQFDSVVWEKGAIYRVYRSGASLRADAAQSVFVYAPSDYLVYESVKLYGYRDAFGQVLIEPRFDSAKPFLKTDFLAAASQKGLWGVIGRDGRFVVPPRYEQVRPHPNVIAVKKAGKWGYVSIKNEPIGRIVYTEVDDWGKEISSAGRVYMNDRSMLLGEDGEYRYRDDDMIISSEDGAWRVTDRFGRVIFSSSRVNKIYDFSCGRARVRIDGMFIDDYGYIDYHGDVVIPIKYSEATDFENDRAIVAEGNVFRNRMEIDKNGQVIRKL